jgi:hypothetical protein
MPIKPFFSLLSFLCTLCLLSFSVQTFAQNKLALVIANLDYESGKPNRNTLQDAQNLANVLEQLCFEVILKTNLNYDAMDDAIYHFTRRLKRMPQGEALFYFAGLGAQGQGQHFLIPINNYRIRSERDLRFKAVSVSQLVGDMTATKVKNVILLDACYDRPYNAWDAQSLCYEITKKQLPFSNYSGLIVGYPHEDTLRNSQNIYTETLIQKLTQTIRRPISIQSLFIQIDNAVYSQSYRRQLSWHVNINLKDFQFGKTPSCGNSGGGSSPKSCSCCSFMGCVPCPCK